MSKRVHLPADERREQIVRGALQIFAEKGFDATTNKEIARVSGIASAGLIYHYFQDKFDLLRAVIEMQMAKGPVGDLPDNLLQMSLEEGLQHFARRFLREISDPNFVAFTRVLLGEAMRRPEFARILSEVITASMFKILPSFFRFHQEQGNIRAVDPVLTSLRFVGAGLSVFMMREVLRVPVVRELDLDTIAKGMVDDFLHGIVSP